MTILKLKRGDTFKFTAKLTGDTEAPIDITNIDIKIDIRHKKDPVRKFSIGKGITKTNPAGGEYEVLDNETYNYPVGNLNFDIQYEIAGEIISTETIVLVVEEDMTR